MTLIVEDGSLVAGANSYVSVQEARDFAALRGSTFSGDDATVAAFLVQATDYLEGFRGRYKGIKVSEDQELQWPRYDVYIDGYLMSETDIPKQLKQAQCQLALDIAELGDILPNGTGREVLSTKVDVIETTYAQRNSGVITPILQKATRFLAPLINRNSSFPHVARA